MMDQRHGDVVFDRKKYRKQLWGWFSYAFASEVFVIVSLTLFLPICLEQFARDNGYLLPDKIVSLYVNSMSVALQALTVISMGNIADHPPHRKRLLLFFAYFGATASIAFLLLPSSSPVWPLSALFAICGNVGFGASFVALNAYLPSLARDSEEVTKKRAELYTAIETAGGTATAHTSLHTDSGDFAPESEASEPLLSQANQSPEVFHVDASVGIIASLRSAYTAELSRATSRISSEGIALGYTAGIVLLMVALIPVNLLHGTTFSLRLAIGMSGIWWALFSIPAAAWLPSSTTVARATVEDEWSEDDVQGVPNKDRSTGREILKAWRRLGGMLRLRNIKRLRNTFKFLAAWFLLSDGFTTITATAMLFAKTSLNMPASALVIIGILSPASGIAGSLVWPRIQKRYGWTNLRILLTLLCMGGLVPAYGCLGFLSPFRNGTIKFGGLTTPGEIYFLAVFFGSIYGALQGYTRAFYSELIPAGEEARWYALFSITDKSSSFFGPLVVGIIADATGNIRYAFFFLAFMVWLAVPVLLSIDVERGRRDASTYNYRT